MALEIGKIYEGKIDKITDYGAFIKFENGDSGLCHISEIANGFVKNVSEHLELHQSVKAKVLSINGKKVNLSIKQTKENGPADSKPKSFEHRGKPKFDRKDDRKDFRKDDRKDFRRDDRKDFRRDDRKFNDHGNRPNKRTGENFEDMLAGFIKNSDDKLRTIKKASKANRRGNGFNR